MLFASVMLVAVLLISCGKGSDLSNTQSIDNVINDSGSSLNFVLGNNPQKIIIHGFDEIEYVINDEADVNAINQALNTCEFVLDTNEDIEGLYDIDIQYDDMSVSLGINDNHIAYKGYQFKITKGTLETATSIIRSTLEKPIDDNYGQVIDRIVVKYDEENLEPLAWNNTVEWNNKSDLLIQMAEDSTGRYKVLGVISTEEGCRGVILDDTIDGTDSNYNYVEDIKWFYSGNGKEKPKLKWNDAQTELYFTYQSADEKEVTVQIDCGYDTGHMELVD